MPNQLSELESARLKLALGARAADPELARSLHQVTCIAAETLGVERVSVWLIEAEWKEIRCVLTFDRIRQEYTSGIVLKLSEFPAYAQALMERRVIPAEDAQNDPRTRELHDYLNTFGITGLLDCPVYANGEVVAIVCHERVGKVGPWQKREQDFGGSVADIVGTILAQNAALRYETELRIAREELAHARVMDSLGRMAAGVAHDFNNVLSGLSLALHVLDAALPSNAPERESAADGLELVERGARLVKQLLTFAKQGAPFGPPVDPEKWLGEKLMSIARSLGPDVRLNAILESGPALIGLDPSVFEQVVVNLTTNARDAMPGGGEITLRTLRRGDQFVLSVSDNGLGMDSETRQRVFEPFFTTKDRRGTGLGLAIVFGAIRSANGTISVQSEPGRGATFTLELPILTAS